MSFEVWKMYLIDLRYDLPLFMTKTSTIFLIVAHYAIKKKYR